MSSNSYNYKYPYQQQSSAQQYPSYQTAPPSNPNTKSSRQFQAPSAAPSQSADYLTYSGTSYGSSSTGYGAAQDNTWSGSGSNYGTPGDNGSRAAEVLRNMSKNSYTATTAAPGQSVFTAPSAVSAHHSSGRSPQVEAQSLRTSHTGYDRTQARPRSVNTDRAQASASRGLLSPATAAGYPSQRTPLHSQQQLQRTGNPDQYQYGQSNTTAASINPTMTVAGSSQHNSDRSHRHVPDSDSSRSSHVVPLPTSYTPQASATVFQPLVSSTPEPYTGSSTTVDPMAVYDPWPSYQRQQAIKDAERAGREKKGENVFKEKERLEAEERKQREAAEEARQLELAANQPKPRVQSSQTEQTHAPVAAPAEAPGSSTAASDLEAEIRSMMAKMRELNGKDPQLLARIWEEERRAKAAPSTKSPTLTTKPAPQPAIAPPVGISTPPIANQGKKATSRESFSAPATRPTMQAPPIRATAATPARTGGTTIWPPEKKFELAKAAAHYLTSKNPDRPIGLDQILEMLNANPSYVELCEQLEHLSFKLDRSIFAKTLLLAVPDVNSSSRKQSGPVVAAKLSVPPAIPKRPAPPAVMKNPVAIPVAPSPRYAPARDSSVFTPFPKNDTMAAPLSTPVAEMIPLSQELKPPANKEEAARKRNLSDLVDLTQLDDDDHIGPPMKRFHANTYTSPHAHAMDVDMAPVSNFPRAGFMAPIRNFPIPSAPVPAMSEPVPRTVPSTTQAADLRYRALAEPLDKKKALRRNTYNPATIARDVLLACGRHPSERQLNQHLDVLKAHLPQISNESDLSTIKWDLIDPGNPPPEYFKDSVQALIEDADDEDASGDEDVDRATRREPSHAESARVQALPEATNPFIKQKRRGRPPRHSLPNTTSSTPDRQSGSAKMSAITPRSPSASVGYSAFREYGPDGNPLPKKKGRPVGWRKAIHGSAAAQNRPVGKHAPQQPSLLRNGGAATEPIRIDSRSPTVTNHSSQYQSFKCKWQNCKAELHNLDTLKLHVYKVHKEASPNTLACLWDDCGKDIASHDLLSNLTLERRVPHAFAGENAWREHIQQNHFDPLAWEQGDGPAGGLSGTED